jgi:hypothetical protein
MRREAETAFNCLQGAASDPQANSIETCGEGRNRLGKEPQNKDFIADL